MKENTVIRLENVSKYYKLYHSQRDRLKEIVNIYGRQYHKKYYALKNVELNIKKGQILGMVGENGSGKSTLLKLISSVLKPSAGRIIVNGRISALLELGAGFNPQFTGIENIKFYSTIMGMQKDVLEEKLGEIIEFAGLGEYINQPLKNYSSGMRARLGFAVAVNVDPDILIVDEVLAVGDESFRRKCYLKMEKFFNSGKTVIYVSHNLGSINEICNRAILLNKGNIVFDGEPKLATTYYRKLINTKESDRASILKDISSISSEDYSINDKNENNEYENEYYEEIQNQTKIYHSKYNVESSDHELKTVNGDIVNHLFTGREYIFEFKIKIASEVGRINFGFGITNEKGVGLSWAFYPGINSYVNIEENNVVNVKCHFDCLFTSGLYYLTATVRNDREELISQVKDCYAFRVNDPMAAQVGGAVNCNPRIAIHEI